MAKAKLTLKKNGVVQTPENNKVLKWFHDNKDVIIGGITFGLGVLVTSIFTDKVIKGAKETFYTKGYTDGYGDAVDWASFGCDCSKTISGMDYEYAGYGEFHDCDDEMAEALLKHAESLGLGEDHIKTIKQVIFMEMDSDLPTCPPELRSMKH